MKIIKGTEVSSFRSLGDTYFARDEKRIYAYGKQLPKADLPSWELLSHWYSRDARRVYYLNREIKGADWDSFTVCTPLDAPPLADHRENWLSTRGEHITCLIEGSNRKPSPNKGRGLLHFYRFSARTGQ